MWTVSPATESPKPSDRRGRRFPVFITRLNWSSRLITGQRRERTTEPPNALINSFGDKLSDNRGPVPLQHRLLFFFFFFAPCRFRHVRWHLIKALSASWTDHRHVTTWGPPRGPYDSFSGAHHVREPLGDRSAGRPRPLGRATSTHMRHLAVGTNNTARTAPPSHLSVHRAI